MHQWVSFTAFNLSGSHRVQSESVVELHRFNFLESLRYQPASVERVIPLGIKKGVRPDLKGELFFGIVGGVEGGKMTGSTKQSPVKMQRDIRFTVLGQRGVGKSGEHILYYRFGDYW